MNIGDTLEYIGNYKSCHLAQKTRCTVTKAVYFNKGLNRHMVGVKWHTPIEIMQDGDYPLDIFQMVHPITLLLKFSAPVEPG